MLTPAIRLPEFDPNGQKKFQQRAVRALPKLVRQAKAEETIFYSDLAHELGMPNPRNLNKVLGAVADVIRKLRKTWKKPVPWLNFVVVNRHTGMPGKGVAGIVSNPTAFRRGTRAYRRRVVRMILHEVFSYRDWDRLLAHLGLKPEFLPPPPSPPPLPPDSLGHGAGEGEDHRRLKEFVARNPEIIGLKGFPKGKIEHIFPSGDVIDILFTTNKRWVGVEVKGIKSDELDIRRGLYQAVKYTALMEACLKAEQKKLRIEVILILGAPLPKRLRRQQDMLGIECRGSISRAPLFIL